MAKKRLKQQTQHNAAPMVEKTRDDELYVISDYLRTLQFAPAFLGVDQVDVWKKIEKLCELYADALAAERGHREALQRRLTARTVGDGVPNGPSPEEKPYGK